MFNWVAKNIDTYLKKFLHSFFSCSQVLARLALATSQNGKKKRNRSMDGKD